MKTIKRLKYKKKSQRPKKKNKRQTRKIKGGGAVPMKKMVDSIVNLAETIIKDGNTKGIVQGYIDKYKQLNENTSEYKNIYFQYLNGCSKTAEFSDNELVMNSKIELAEFFEKILNDIQHPQDICIIIYLLLQLTMLIKNKLIDYDRLLYEIKNFIQKKTYYKDLHFIDINLTYIFDIIYSYLETAGKSDDLTGGAYKTMIGDGLSYLNKSLNSKESVLLCGSSSYYTEAVICILITKNHTLIQQEITSIINLLKSILKGEMIQTVISGLQHVCNLYNHSKCNVKNQRQLGTECRKDDMLLHDLTKPQYEIKQQYCYEKEE